MNDIKITKEKLIALWRMRNNIFYGNGHLANRFDRINKLFEKIIDTNVSFTEDAIYVNGKEVVLHRANGDQNPSRCYFSCAKDGMTADSAFQGIENMKAAMPDYSSLVEEIGCMLGGFDFDSKEMKPEYRIVSNTVTKSNDAGTLISSGQIRHPSSHLADNNYFFNVVDTVNTIKNDEFDPNVTRLVLRWPTKRYYGEDWEDAEQSQKSALECRFPYKYFYMWTHKEECIHLVSLAACRNLASQEDTEIKYKHDINFQSFSDFINEDGWRTYSEALCEMIPEEERGDDFMSNFSKLLSIIMLEEQDAKNIRELLETGNQAIVLWGPPGTGKTYTAKSLVCQKLGIKDEDLPKYKFSVTASEETASEEKEKDKAGYWDIVQFHPSYTYEDFIGGIMPILDGKNIGYTLKSGVFKRMCDAAVKQPDKPFILIIDEINRADLSSIFGELMYALEYRGEQVTLPNFEEPFVIPRNVYIIGTMNNVDKSLATFDLALRRRFGFCKVGPNVDVLERIIDDVEEESLQKFIKKCRELNEVISDTKNVFNLGEDFQIGHAYFAKIKDFLKSDKDGCVITSFDMEKLWIYHIEPLMEEYLGNKMDTKEVKVELKKQKENFVNIDKANANT